MNNQIKVSVVVPIYNMEMHIDKCIKSIQQQTHANLEIILVDDGSTDQSFSICREFEKHDVRIFAFTKDNGGVSTARNLGIKKSTGDFIMFVDPDDYLDPTIIDQLLCEFSNSVDIVACCCTVCFANGNKEVNHFFKENRVFTNDNKTELFLQLMNSSHGQPGKAYTAIGVPWGKLYRREFLERYNLLFDVSLRRVQDNIFNMYAFFYASEIIYIDKGLYNYRYDHMGDYYKKYNSSYVQIFTNVRISRYKCMQMTGLLEDDQLRDGYINESIVSLVGILKNGVFCDGNALRFNDKCLVAERIKSLDCFNVAIENYSENNLKYQICCFLIRNKHYRLFSLLAKL